MEVCGGPWGRVPRDQGGAEVLGNPRIGRNDIDVCDRDVVMNVLLHLCHDPINFGKIGHICFYPLLLRVGRRGKGGMAAHLFVAHKLTESQRRGRICLFTSPGALKATRPNKRTKKVRKIGSRNINIKYQLHLVFGHPNKILINGHGMGLE